MQFRSRGSMRLRRCQARIVRHTMRLARFSKRLVRLPMSLAQLGLLLPLAALLPLLITSLDSTARAQESTPERVVSELPESTPGLAPAIEFYAEAMGARQAGNIDGYIAGMEKALLALPGHAILMRHLAQGHALAGRNDEAVAWLEQVAATGAWFELGGNPDFRSLIGTDAFDGVQDRIGGNRSAHGDASASFTVNNPLLIPEGMAYDPVTQSFFLSSIRERRVVRVDASGQVSNFTTDSADDLYCGLGMKVDAERRHLWLVTAAFGGMAGFREELRGRATLSCFDLDSGVRKIHIEQSNDELEHNFNDLDLDSTGRVYLTDSIAGAILSLAPGAEELEVLVEPGVLNGPNGIALNEVQGLLYIARYNLDIVALDLDSGELWSLAELPSASLYGTDGLYFHEGGLIAIQNHPSLDRIMRFELSEDGKHISGEKVLLRRDARFHEPTTGSLAEGRFHFIANSQIETFMSMGEEVRVDELVDVIVLGIDL